MPSGGGGRGAVRSDSLIFVLDAGRFRHALRGLHTREHRSRSVPRGRGVGRQIGDQAKMRRCAKGVGTTPVAAPHTLNMYSVLVAEHTSGEVDLLPCKTVRLNLSSLRHARAASSTRRCLRCATPMSQCPTPPLLTEPGRHAPSRHGRRLVLETISMCRTVRGRAFRI